MRDVELVMELLSRIDGSEKDAVLARACLQILVEEPEAEPKPEPKKRKEKPFDMGKLKALLDGGWSVGKIADEMGVSDVTIYKKIKVMKEQERECTD